MKTIEERIHALEHLVDIQCTHGTWNYDPYMMGMANGLLLALYTIKDEKGEVPYKSKPEQWLADLPPLEPIQTESLKEKATNEE